VRLRGTVEVMWTCGRDGEGNAACEMTIEHPSLPDGRIEIAMLQGSLCVHIANALAVLEHLDTHDAAAAALTQQKAGAS